MLTSGVPLLFVSRLRSLRFRITRLHNCLDVPADVEITFDLHSERVACLDEIFENYVDNMLVKDLHFAKRIDVEFEALQLDASLVRHILKPNNGEIGEFRERTNRREFGHLKLDPNLPSRKFVCEGVERVKPHLFTRRRLDIELLEVLRLELGLV